MYIHAHAAIVGGGLICEVEVHSSLLRSPLFFLEVGRKGGGGGGGGGHNSVAVWYNNAWHCSAVAVVILMLREEGLIYTFKCLKVKWGVYREGGCHDLHAQI